MNAIAIHLQEGFVQDAFLLYLLLGLTAGILSGLVDIGGGIIRLPAPRFLFGLPQHQA